MAITLPETVEELQTTVHKFARALEIKERVCNVLMDRVERSVAQSESSYSLFETNILLQDQVNKRTAELEQRTVELNQAQLLAEQAVALRNAKESAEQVAGELANTLQDLEQNNLRLQLMKQVFLEASEAIMVLDSIGNIIEVNPAFEKITGFSKQTVSGKNPSIMASSQNDRDLYNEIWGHAHQHGYWSNEIWNKRLTNETYPIKLKISILKSGNFGPTKYVGLFSDISKEKASEKKLINLAFYDTLTGLANRLLCSQELSSRLKAAKRRDAILAVLFVDLDGFKTVNDSMGHKMGDEVLVFVANQFKQIVRESDLVSRYGGDEFLILLSDLQQVQEASNIAESMINLFKDPIHLSNGKEVFLNCSIGITLAPDDTMDPKDLIRFADAAMYEAKEAGKGRFHFFSKDIEQRVLHRIALDYKIRKAMKKNEFVVYYQPQVNSSNGKLVGVESLIRWESPDKGLLTPDEFIPLTEETGLIQEIGEFVLTESCRQNKQWQDEGVCHVTISVNCSVRQFDGEGLPAIVKNALQITGLDPKFLKIEITESLMMNKNYNIIAQLKELKKIGVGLSLDDFGTGYSSLSLLKVLPLSDIKIDRTFVENITTDHMIAQMITDLAKQLNLQLIAEGAEKWEQVEKLYRLGCDRVQGFFYSTPLKAKDISNFINQSPHQYVVTSCSSL